MAGNIKCQVTRTLLRRNQFVLLLLVTMIFSSCQRDNIPAGRDIGNHYEGWENYAGTKDGSRYSLHTEINRDNVNNLEVAWMYNTGDKDSLDRSQIQCNAIIIDGVLYGVSPSLKLFALDAATGKERWVFDPATHEGSDDEDPLRYVKVSRGVAYWESPDGSEARIFHRAVEKIWSVDATTGLPDPGFGKNGFISLQEDLDRDPDSFNPYITGTTPGIVYRDLLITGMRVAESADAAPGHIRAYDVQTGERKWIFHTIPHPGETGYDTWPDREAYQKLGGANCWAGMSLDDERGIVYIPTGSISGDFYGGIREGKNLFANSLVALKAATGKYLWHFQVIHHDLWDRDLAANPNLVTIRKEGKETDAVAQITKHGYIFLFDRVSGKPLFPVNEVAVSQNALPGEKPWPTQPVPELPEPFARQEFGEEDVYGLTPAKQETMLNRFRQIRYNEMFAPPSREGSWILPGFDGGGEWGGAAVDPETQILYVNSSELPWSMVMMERPETSMITGSGDGRQVYNTYCIACHGTDLKGSSISFPSLENIGEKYARGEILNIIDYGINMMPSFGHLHPDDISAVADFIIDPDARGREEKGPGPGRDAPRVAGSGQRVMEQVPFIMTGYNRFLDDDGYPGIKPPWGTLNAVDLVSGKLMWKVPLGEYPGLTELGIPPTGTENYGGPAVTAGGLVFIAATKDAMIRAFDKTTGEELWKAELPVPGYATPAVYSVNGKQYIVIACGGGKIGSPSGDSYVAFALPSNP